MDSNVLITQPNPHVVVRGTAVIQGHMGDGPLVTKDSISSPNAWIVFGKGGLIQKHSRDGLDVDNEGCGRDRRAYDNCSEHVSTLNMQLDVFSITSNTTVRMEL